MSDHETKQLIFCEAIADFLELFPDTVRVIGIV